MKILIVEDNPDHQEIIEDTCREAFREGVLLSCEATLQAGIDALNQQHFDIFLCDLTLADGSIQDTSKSLQNLQCQTPIIVLTSHDDYAIAKELLLKGIQDYIPKSNLNAAVLHRICTYAMQRKHYEVKLEQHNADMQAFCRSLSHDFNGSLRRIHKVAHFIREDLGERIVFNEDDEKWFGLLDANLASARKLVDDLHQYLSFEAGPVGFSPVNLNDLFAYIDDQVALDIDKKYTLKWGELATIDANESQLFILFKNLVLNGIKYNENSPLIQISCAVSDATNTCQMTIEDNGIGMSEQSISKIFVPFQRFHSAKEYPGSGLGLSIVKRIIEKHKGNIAVDSTPGKGTRMIVSLPIHHRPIH